MKNREKNLDSVHKYRQLKVSQLACSPVSINSEYINMFFRAYLVKNREKNLDSVHKYRQSSVVEVSVWQQKSLRSIQREAKRLTRVTKNEVKLNESRIVSWRTE